MPAYLVEPPSEEDLGEFLTSAAAPQAATQGAPQEPPKLEGDDVPEKYRGKTAAELLQIVRDQESYIGRLGQEKGELRQRVGTLEGLVDKALHLRDPGVATQASAKEDDLTDLDFDRKPREAVQKLVQRELEPVRGKLQTLDQRERAAQFEREHPTAVQDINDPAFVEFVKGSKYRANLATRAFGDPSNYDFEAAEELWAAWEEKRGAAPAAAPATEAPPQAPVSQGQGEKPPALIPSGSGGGSSGHSSGKPVYYQEALERLQLSNPEKYWAPDVQARIAEAYREGRVISGADPRARR